MKTLEELKETPRLKIIKVTEEMGMGDFYKPGEAKPFASVVWSVDDGLWEHISICPYNHKTPDRDTMRELKRMFFHDDECPAVYYPRIGAYVNIMPNCEHLWNYIGGELPTPF